MKKIWNRIVENFIGEKMTEDEFYEEFPELSPIEEEGFVPLDEYEEEIKKEQYQINQVKMMTIFDDLVDCINDKSKKMLSNVKIGSYIIDGILFTKKGIFLISCLSLDKGYVRGSQQDTYLDYFKQSEMYSFGKNKNVVKKAFENNPNKKILNPLGELVVWKQQIKKVKQFEKINFYTVILSETGLYFDDEFAKTPYLFNNIDLAEFINYMNTNVYTKEQLEEFYNSFVTYDN